jgi:hypothetical protein
MDKLSLVLPNATNLLKFLPPFDFGPRPSDLIGRTSMMAIENNDEDGDFLYYGEIATYDGQTMCG